MVDVKVYDETTEITPEMWEKVRVQYGFAPGDYTCKCYRCGEQFWGDKRAPYCEPCAKIAAGVTG